MDSEAFRTRKAARSDQKDHTVMEHLQSVFMDEAAELLMDLEKGLLKLETNPADNDGIAKAFRCMHTLKGSARMFGFNGIHTLTHQLESIYQSIREGNQDLTPAILQITYQCLDHLRKLLSDPSVANTTLQVIQARLLEETGKLSKEIPSAEIFLPDNAQSKEVKKSVWYISFIPDENILQHGTNSLYLIEDLLALGSGIALPYFIKNLEWNAFDAGKNYTAFEILLESACTEIEIQDVFMFVQSEGELIIRPFAGNGIALTKSVRQQVREAHHIHIPVGYANMNTLLVPNASLLDDPLLTTQRNSKGSVRVPSERLDDLINLVSELVTTQARLSLFATESIASELVTIAESVENITRRLRDNAFSMSLIPVESLVVRFQRLVRDLSKELGKEVIFKTEGTETEIDKSIIEKLTDPVLHLLRNALDHGIESPDKRQQQGKPRQGTVLVKAYYSGTHVVIEINDDGAGIDLNKVKQKAITTGLISAGDTLTEDELTQLIFHPGFSTAERVTGVSGRGVGMDVVKRNITDIQGEIEINTKPGLGTTFLVRLPLTLSIIDGLLVSTGPTGFILPMSAVRKCYEVETVLLENETHHHVVLEGQRIPVFNLCKVFTPDEPVLPLSQVITVQYNKKIFGLAVASIIGQYQAVLKPLGNSYIQQDEFSGATILGDGTVALVIDPNKLIRNLMR